MIILALAEDSNWLNYPGLEVWKFINLAIFLGVGIYVMRRRISDALGTRRESIRQELIDAREQEAQALAKVADADSLLSGLDADVRTVHEQSRQEAAAERERVKASAAQEIEKLKQQAEREVDTANRLARKSLRKFLAQRSVEFARGRVRDEIGPEADRKLIEESIGELRRARV